MAAQTWQPYDSLTQAPTNLKEAIDWVLRVTGKDGKPNKAPAQPAPSPNPPQFGCLCYLAKAVKDLLYDARDPGSPGPTPERYWDGILLKQESAIVKPVLTDLGLVKSGSTSATSTTYTFAGGTEVIKALIDHLALGLQKWVGWQEGDKCCLKGAEGIGKKCECTGGGGGGNCCTGVGSSGSTTTCHNCQTCGTSATSSGAANKKCYQSAYSKTTALWTTIVNGGIGTSGVTVNTVKAAQEVHLLARIFLGSVCLIWSGLSQLGFLTSESGGNDRWKDSKLNYIETGDNKGLGSFMAAMGYDLDRLNQGHGKYCLGWS